MDDVETMLEEAEDSSEVLATDFTPPTLLAGELAAPEVIRFLQGEISCIREDLIEGVDRLEALKEFLRIAQQVEAIGGTPTKAIVFGGEGLDELSLASRMALLRRIAKGD